MINRLFFRTNAHTIIPFLKSQAATGSGHPRFSLNSIVALPETLILPLNDDVIRLSLLNIDVPILDEKVKSRFLLYFTPAYTGKQPHSLIVETLREIRERLLTASPQKQLLDNLDRAACNYENSGFFSQFDWCIDHWGTSDDIEGVTESTFELPTAFIEFATVAAPPIIALQQLANIFPSVVFTLQYRLASESDWNEVQFYPFPPFGY